MKKETLSKEKNNRLRIWTKMAWKRRWVNKKFWFDEEELYASIYSYLTHNLGMAHKKHKLFKIDIVDIMIFIIGFIIGFVSTRFFL